MPRFRITKYDPVFRNESGEYILNEWTSYHDIGQKFYDGILTKEKYLKQEDGYIHTIELILDDNNLNSMRLVQLEKYRTKELSELLSKEEKEFIKNMRSDMLMSRDDIKKVSRLILREFVWGKLESIDKLVTIEFGYDYYMYVVCEKISDKKKESILEKGLFVEDMQRQGDGSIFLDGWDKRGRTFFVNFPFSPLLQQPIPMRT